MTPPAIAAGTIVPAERRLPGQHAGAQQHAEDHSAAR